MSPLVLTVLFKRYFGCYLANLRANRRRTGVQVGINPLSDDWRKLVDDLMRVGKNVFDGDYGKWDKKMLQQFQTAVADHILAFCNYHGDDLVIAKMLLQILCTTPTITNDEIIITTHSLPSGISGTAEFNSLINKMYGAYAFCSLYFKKHQSYPDVTTYIQNVCDNVYGDDKITSVSDKYVDLFNGATYEREMNALGLDFTPADKGEWTYTTRSYQECTFLKRAFKLHHELADIVAPLNEISMCGTLNFVKDDFRNDELTMVKLHNFQREAYLHSDKYGALMFVLDSFLKDRDIPFVPLTPKYLKELYTSGKFSDLLDLT
jgi:hypothetical protein